MKPAYGKDPREVVKLLQKRSVGEVIFDIFNVLFMLFMIVVCLYPMLFVLFASLSEASQLVQFQGILLRPLGLNLESYKLVFAKPEIMTGYMNTIIVVVCGVTINIILSSLGAYCLSRKGVFWNGLFAKLIVITMFFSGGIVPLFLTIKDLGIYDTRLALILPVAINTYNMIIMRTSFSEIPDSLSESAQIDGAGHMTILFKLVLPLSKPVIAVMVLFYGVSHWNAWAQAVMFLQDPNKFPLQLILRDILLQNQVNDMVGSAGEVDRLSISETIKYATIIIATLPILCLYPFLQKFFQKGIMIGSVKG